MRMFRFTLSACAAIGLLCSLNTGSAWGGFSITSVNQSVEAQVGGSTQSQFNTTPPPVDISAVITGGNGAEATQTISFTTTSETISLSVVASVGRSSAIFGTRLSTGATSNFEMTFFLEEAYLYDFSTFGTINFTGPEGSVSEGTGILGPGEYTISNFLTIGPSSSSGSQSLTSDFLLIISPAESSEVVPEPSSFALLGLGAVTLAGYGWRRRKPQRS